LVLITLPFGFVAKLTRSSLKRNMPLQNCCFFHSN